MQIVLFEPQIPQNTGNVARTCAVTGSSLRLIPPMGFEIKDKELKRAGLDYWSLLDIETVECLETWLQTYGHRCIFYSAHATRLYTDIEYRSDSILVFGAETHGLPQSWRERWPEQFVRVPMRPFEQARCLNQSTCVGIALYEALRQTGFEGIE